MSPWDSLSRWINTVLLIIVGFLGFDTLFRLLDANEQNVIVAFARRIAVVLLEPFQGMFEAQEFLLTALIAVLGYALVAGVALAVVRSIQATLRRRRPRDPVVPSAPYAYDPTTEARGSAFGDDATQRLDGTVQWPPPDGPSPSDTAPGAKNGGTGNIQGSDGGRGSSQSG